MNIVLSNSQILSWSLQHGGRPRQNLLSKIFYSHMHTSAISGPIIPEIEIEERLQQRPV